MFEKHNLENFISQEEETFFALGEWRAEHAKTLSFIAENFMGKSLNLSQVEVMDTFAVVLILRLKREKKINISNIPPKYLNLFRTILKTIAKEPFAYEKPKSITDKLQEFFIVLYQAVTTDFAAFLQLIGNIGLALTRNISGKSRFHFIALVHQLDLIALKAVPIVILITFLIGAIITQQGIFHFRTFGADIFVVDMVGILMLREVGVLIVAIMIAGRTGSAYTAEIGSMKIREEVDALLVMGLDPVDLLVIPRVFAMVIGLPLLTIIGDLSAIFGGIIVAQIYGDISPETFLNRFQEVVNVRHFWVGIVKAPFMAMIIGLIACIEGLRVSGSALSLGLHTTASVVKSIFMVIVLNGFFALFFAVLGV